MPDSERTIGERFQASTKYRRDGRLLVRQDLVVMHKVYANPLEVAALPVPELQAGEGLWSVLAKPRESLAEGGRLAQQDMSQILWAAAGFTYSGQRTHVSAALASGLETYLIVQQLDSFFPGVYHYNIKDHSLEYLVNTEPSQALRTCLIEPNDISPYAAVLVFTGLPKRIDDGAASRVYRYLYLEAGAAAQAAMLAANALGLACYVTSEFYDDDLANLLQVGGSHEFPLCALLLGR
ncbi:MAG: nitroreductase family protein [Deinococcota bacterium]